MRTQQEILSNISDIQLKKYAKDIIDYQVIGGFHETSTMPSFIEKIKSEWNIDNDADALSIALNILSGEIIKRYAA